MKSLRLTLPLPPSVNAIWRVNQRTGMPYLSPKVRDWKKRALASLWPQKPQGGFPLFSDALSAHVLVPLKMRGDVDNRQKALLDFLQKPAGVLTDDKHIHVLSISRSSDVAPNTCQVVLWEGESPAPQLNLGRAA